MNNTNFAIKCLELMDFRYIRHPISMHYCWINFEGECVCDPKSEQDEIDFTLTQLAGRNDVKERACNFVNQKIDEWDGSEEMPPPIDYCKGEIRAFIFPVGWVLKDFAWLLDKYAIPLGITPEQLMGVEG